MRGANESCVVVRLSVQAEHPIEHRSISLTLTTGLGFFGKTDTFGSLCRLLHWIMAAQ